MTALEDDSACTSSMPLPTAKGDTSATNAQSWQRVRAVLDVALPLSGAERAARLDDLCAEDAQLRAEVESLIDAHEQAGTFIDRSVFGELPGLEDDLLVDREGEDEGIGPYQFHRLLGRGGMGSVYLASRQDRDFARQVAVKVLHRDVATVDIVNRFRGERRILASLEHPSIARLIDGASDDGRPYLVLEYIDGQPIDRYCHELELTIEERLRLFISVCGAVHYAHQRLVVHRDLKPSNILVTVGGEVKLLDFGIAKLIDDSMVAADDQVPALRTTVGAAPMTPAYASPEQVLGQPVTTASDVYALGVVLYELLTESDPLPLDGSYHQQVMAICQHQPARPSARVTDRRRRRQLVHELDNIVLKALRKEPERRYSTAESLANDLEAYLDGRPVSARPSTWTYRTRKLIGRHKLVFAVLGALYLAIVAFSAALWQQRARILEEQRRANAVAEFLIDLFEMPDPYRGIGEQLTVREALARGATLIDSELADEPGIRAALLEALGRSYQNLALYDEARPLLEAALDDRQRLYDDQHPAIARSVQLLADLDLRTGRYDAAAVGYARALDLRLQSMGSDRPELVESLEGLAVAREELGDSAAADSALQQAMARARQLDSSHQASTLAPLLDHASEVLRHRGDYEQARAWSEEALAIQRRRLGADHPAVALTLNNLALIEKHRQPRRAEALLREAEVIQRRAFTEPHAHLALTLANLGRLLHESQRLDEARSYLEEASSIQRQVYARPHPRTATIDDFLAGVQADMGDLDAAIAKRRELLAMRRAMLGEEHLDVARSYNGLAKLLVVDGRPSEAETLFRDALRIVRQQLGDGHRHVGSLLNNLGETLAAQGRTAEAESEFVRAVDILRDSVASTSHLLAAALGNLGRIEAERGASTLARRHLSEALDIVEERWGQSSAQADDLRRQLAEIK